MSKYCILHVVFNSSISDKKLRILKKNLENLKYKNKDLNKNESF